MMQNKSSNKKTHYEIIGVEEDASHEEIRGMYRSAILNCHPDKLQRTPETSNLQHEFCGQFLDVQNAWSVLGNPKSRAIYDNELQTLKLNDVTAEDVNLEDLIIEDVGDGFEFWYNCRCGDFFSVGSSELGEMGFQFLRNDGKISLQVPSSLPAYVILPCGSCSLKIRLCINADVTLEIEPNK